MLFRFGYILVLSPLKIKGIAVLPMFMIPLKISNAILRVSPPFEKNRVLLSIFKSLAFPMAFD
jgi:hypothetical protein